MDGADGAGKSTVADMACARLTEKGRKVKVLTHPNRSTVAGRLSAKFLCFPGKPMQLISTVFYIVDVLGSLRYKRKHEIEFDDFIFVRYILAVGYLPEAIILTVYDIISKLLPMPDHKAFVDLGAEKSMERIIERGEELEVFETVDKLEKVNRKMHKLTTSGWTVIDNSGTMEETSKQVDAFLRTIE